MSYVAQLDKDKKMIIKVAKKKQRNFGLGYNLINQSNLGSNLKGATNSNIEPKVILSIYQVAAAAKADAKMQREKEKESRSGSTVTSAYLRHHESSSS